MKTFILLLFISLQANAQTRCEISVINDINYEICADIKNMGDSLEISNLKPHISAHGFQELSFLGRKKAGNKLCTIFTHSKNYKSKATIKRATDNVLILVGDYQGAKFSGTLLYPGDDSRHAAKLRVFDTIQCTSRGR